MNEQFAYVEIVRNTPLTLVFIFFVFVAPQLGWTPSDFFAPAVVALASGATGTGVPDLTGLSAREALRELARLGLSVRMQGAGVVVHQDPPAGAPLEPGATCTIILNRRPHPRPHGAIGEQR